MAQEMLRVSREDSLIIWYDFYMNNPLTPDIRGIRKHEITELFPHRRIELHRVTLAPPLARFLAPFSWLLVTRSSARAYLIRIISA